MSPEEEDAAKQIYQAFDLMVHAKWSDHILHKPGQGGTAVRVTERGKLALKEIKTALEELGPGLTRELWWAIAMIARMQNGLPGDQEGDHIRVPDKD